MTYYEYYLDKSVGTETYYAYYFDENGDILHENIIPFYSWHYVTYYDDVRFRLENFVEMDGLTVLFYKKL